MANMVIMISVICLLMAMNTIITAQAVKRLIASAKGWKINLQVCYDLRFPVWTRQSLHPRDSIMQLLRTRPSHFGEGAGSEGEYHCILIYVANWPERHSLAWKTLLQARAIENQCYVIGVNESGR